MEKVRIFDPRNESEAAFVVAMLQAHRIPTDLQVLSGALALWVPPEKADAAGKLVAGVRQAQARITRFVTMHRVPEDEQASVGNPRFAVVLARAPQGVTLVFSNLRQVWELPGGSVDAGEKARDCAVREFEEETGGEVSDLQWLGLVEVDDGRTGYGAILSATARKLPAEFKNWETGGLAFWTRERAPQPLGHTDDALLKLFG